MEILRRTLLVAGSMRESNDGNFLIGLGVDAVNRRGFRASDPDRIVCDLHPVRVFTDLEDGFGLEGSERNLNFFRSGRRNTAICFEGLRYCGLRRNHWSNQNETDLHEQARLDAMVAHCVTFPYVGTPCSIR